MNITEQEYGGYIKPLVDKCIVVAKKLTEQEFAIIGERLLRIVDNEFNFELLDKILNSLSPLCLEIANRYELSDDIQNAINFLSTKKSS